MFLRRKTYDDLLAAHTDRVTGLGKLCQVFHRQLGESMAEARVLGEQNRVLQVQLDFMRVQTNQLQKERAILLNQVAGIRIPIPEITSTRDMDSQDILAAMPSFEDMGDEAAAREGIQNDPATGEVRYREVSKDKGDRGTE